MELVIPETIAKMSLIAYLLFTTLIAYSTAIPESKCITPFFKNASTYLSKDRPLAARDHMVQNTPNWSAKECVRLGDKTQLTCKV